MNTKRIIDMYKKGSPIEQIVSVVGQPRDLVIQAITDHNREIITSIIHERLRQNRMHPSFNMFPYWNRYGILAEEVGEVAKALNEGDFVGLVDEIIQVAAVAIRWLEDLHNDGKEPKSTSAH